MDEYQIADLAQQQYGLWQTQHAVVSSSIDFIMLIIFSYVVAAFVFGPKLNKVQYRLISGMYIGWTAFEALDLFVSINVSKSVAMTFANLAPESVPKRLYDYYMGGSIDNVYYSLIFLALIASLYLMRSVRQQKP